MKAELTPEQRAYEDALWLAVEMGVYGEEALEHADRMRGTLWVQQQALLYAVSDLRAELRKTRAGRSVYRLALLLERRPVTRRRR